MKFVASTIAAGTLILLVIARINGNPLLFRQQKPPMCPYGLCFIDQRQICTCVPNEGNTSCVKHELPSYPPLPGNCPWGKVYRSSIWPENFRCFCNNDESRTYECFDLNKDKHITAEELVKITKSRTKQAEKMLAQDLFGGIRIK